MDDRPGRLSDLLWILLPLVVGGAIGVTVGQRIAAGNPADCGPIPAFGTLSTAFILGAIVVVLLVGTVVAMVKVGPIVGRALFIVAVGILLTSCASVVLATPTDPCADASGTVTATPRGQAVRV